MVGELVLYTIVGALIWALTVLKWKGDLKNVFLWKFDIVKLVGLIFKTILRKTIFFKDSFVVKLDCIL